MREYYSTQFIEVEELSGDGYRGISIEYTGSVENDCMWLDPKVEIWYEGRRDESVTVDVKVLQVMYGLDYILAMTNAARDEMIEEWAYGG